MYIDLARNGFVSPEANFHILFISEKMENFDVAHEIEKELQRCDTGKEWFQRNQVQIRKLSRRLIEDNHEIHDEHLHQNPVSIGNSDDVQKLLCFSKRIYASHLGHHVRLLPRYHPNRKEASHRVFCFHRYKSLATQPQLFPNGDFY